MASLARASGTPVLGLEIAESGTHISAYLETDMGPRRRLQRLGAPPTPEEALALLHDHVVRTIYGLSPTELTDGVLLPPLRVGVAFWGQLDRDKRTVLTLRQNASWSGFPLAEALSTYLSGAVGTVDVTVETAINTAAWCEAAGYHPSSRAGTSVKESVTLLYVHVGREVSAAILQDGQFLIKHDNSEERFGHTIVAANGPRCQCGGYGHLTAIASAQSLVRSMIGRASDHDESYAALLSISNGRAEALTAPQVVELATSGNAIAVDILAVAHEALSLAIANVVLLFSPEVIIIGGPLTRSGESFLAPLRARLGLRLGNNGHLPLLQMGLFEPFSSLKGAYALVRAQDLQQPL